MMNTYLIEFEDLALITPLSNEEYGGQTFLYRFRTTTKPFRFIDI